MQTVVYTCDLNDGNFRKHQLYIIDSWHFQGPMGTTGPKGEKGNPGAKGPAGICDPKVWIFIKRNSPQKVGNQSQFTHTSQFHFTSQEIFILKVNQNKTLNCMVNDIMVSLVVTLKDIEYVKTHFSRMFHLYSP